MLMTTTKNHNEEDDDRISKLPDHIIHEILRFIPIRSAAQTMFLSRRWKNVFPSVPDLDFTTIAPPFSSFRPAYFPVIQMEPLCSVRDINFLNNVLSRRDNDLSIRTLRLKSSQLSSSAINFLIKYPKIIDIQELDVNVKNKHYFNIPWRIIGTVRVLKLSILFSDFDNLIHKPSTFINREFKFLHTMTLHNLSFLLLFHDKHIFTDSSFPCLKELTLNSCCRLKELALRCSGLKDLVIKSCGELNELDIYGLKLERLKVKDCFAHSSTKHSKVKIIAPEMKVLKWVLIHSNHTPVFLEKSYLLEKVVIGIIPYGLSFDHYITAPENKQRLSDMMIALSHAKFLKFKYESIEIFSINNVILANKFENLRTLEIIVEYSHIEEFTNFSAIARLFKICPYLDTLIITISNAYIRWDERLMNDSIDDTYWEEQLSEMKSFLDHIRIVKLNGFLESYKDISLAKFLIKHGKVLEEIVLEIELNTQLGWSRQKLMKYALMKCFSASSKVNIVFQ